MPKFSVRKPLTVFVAVLAVIILGVVAFTRMTPDLFPNMDFPYVMIMTTYPGQSPEIVEQEITRPLEQSMATLEHIKSVSSTSSENYSTVVLEFEEDVNMDTIGVDIQQNISTLSDSWDDAVGTPYVLKINPSVIPVAIAAVSMEGMDITELSDFLDSDVVPKLEGVTGVASVSTIGSIYRQVHVVISQDKIDKVNERMAKAVNDRMDDAQKELEDTRAELEDARAELENAQAELESGRDTLVSQSGSAQSALSQQQIQLLEGRTQIQQQMVTLEETKTTLTNALAQLQQAEDAYKQLDEAVSQLTDGIGQIDELLNGLEEARTQRDALQAQADALTAQIEALGSAASGDPSASNEPSGELPSPDDPSVLLAQLQAQLAAAQGALASLDAQIAVLEPQAETASAQRDMLAEQLQTARDSIAALDGQLSAQGMTRADLPDKIDETQAGLSEVNAGIEKLQQTLTQLDSGAIQLSQAMGVLASTQSSSLLQLADASSQLTVNTAAVDQSMEQVESGLESLADSREDALASAEMDDSITISTVSQILAAQNFSMPAGYVEEDGVRYMVSVGDEMTRTEELEALVLFDTGEDAIGPVYLADVADVFVTDNSDETYARLGSEASIMLTFDKQSNAATAEVSDSLRARFDELEDRYPGLKFQFMMDQGDYIYLIVNSIMESLLTGAVFAVIILFLFLRDLRPTVITLVSIPVSVIFAFVLMYFSGVTLNMISLSGLAVAVGMLVDNSIVVIENVYRLRSKGATAIQAAVTGARQVAGAIMASTLTTVCVFLPIVFVEGLTRQLFTDLALTMSYALLASLVVALTLVPAMARGMLRDRRKSGREKKKRQKAYGEGLFYRGYRVVAAWNLRHKFVTLTLAVALLAASAWLCLRQGFSFLPEMDMNTVSVTLAMPENAGREEAVAAADEALARIQTMDNIEYVGAMMGGTNAASLVGGGGGSLDVTVYVGLPEGESGAAAGARIAELCADLDCEVSYDSAMMDMSMLTGSGITVNIYGSSMEQLQKGAETVSEALAEVDGVDQVDNGLEEAQKAYHIQVDRNAAMEKGYTVAQLYMELAAALTDSATAMDMDMDDINADVLVEASKGMTAQQLMDYTFEQTDSDGETTSFQLKDVADLQSTVSLSSITRSEQRRYLAVNAAVKEGYNVTLVTAAAEDALADIVMPEDVSFEFAGENETIMDAVNDMFLMLLMGLALVYFVMVAQFQSLKSPFIVMFTIPLAFTGGFFALLIFHMDVSIVSLIGFVMLMGIIVNNGIVLVDYVNQLRASGMARREALIEAGVTRMRPIFMTSLTTILGLIVMATGRDVGTAIMQPVAVVCIGGLLYATVMTLFVVPCIYDIMNRRDVVTLSDEEMNFEEDHPLI